MTNSFGHWGDLATSAPLPRPERNFGVTYEEIHAALITLVYSINTKNQMLYDSLYRADMTALRHCYIRDVRSDFRSYPGVANHVADVMEMFPPSAAAATHLHNRFILPLLCLPVLPLLWQSTELSAITCSLKLLGRSAIKVCHDLLFWLIG